MSSKVYKVFDGQSGTLLRTYHDPREAADYICGRAVGLANSILAVEEATPGEAFQQRAADARKNANKIECIKAVREYTGLGLLESKTIVEAFW